MRVFISHSSKDKRFVRRLKKDLKANDITTWMDEDELLLGDELTDKLIDALDNSTHFIIVLSQASIESKWVNFELSKAFTKGNASIKKIIPVLWKECELPKEIRGKLYADLSKEIVKEFEDNLSFLSDGYDKELLKIIKSIKSVDLKLTKEDKTQIKRIIEKSENEENQDINSIKFHVSVNGFGTSEKRLEHASYILKKSVNNKEKDVSKILPVVLPNIAKGIFKNIKVGDTIVFKRAESQEEVMGYFSKFYVHSLRLAMDIRLRRLLNLKGGNIYKVEIKGGNEIVFY